MARQPLTSVENQFIRGLITEATALNFPEHAATEIWDCKIDQKGVVTRRLGFASEASATDLSRTTQAGAAVTEYLWTPVSGDGDTQFLVQQVGSTLYFYDTSSSVSVSPNYASLTINLVSHEPAGTVKNSEDYACQYATGKGFLLVVNPACEPFYVEYDASGPSLTVTDIAIRHRDFEGYDPDEDDNDARITANLSDLVSTYPKRLYNILNQGWDTGGALAQWIVARTDSPSNFDYIGNSRKDDQTEFDNSTLVSRQGASSPAPKGHFLLNPFLVDREDILDNIPSTGGGFSGGGGSSYAGTGLAVDRDTDERFSTVAFYAGRAWYAGVNESTLSSQIFFSRIIQNKVEFGQCYQTNDPTSEFDADLLPDDGGVVSIPEIGTIHKLLPVQRTLLVLASNGVWAISGASGVTFKANDYVVQRLSFIGMNSPQSAIIVSGTPTWFAEDGIYQAEYDPSYDTFKVVNSTLPTIKSFYLSIPVECRAYVKCTYDIQNNLGYWLYHSTTPGYSYNRVLLINGLTGAYFPWTISSAADSRAVVGVIYVSDAQKTETPLVKFPTLTPDGGNQDLTYAEARDTDYEDWGATSYVSYLITGYKLDGQTQRFFQGNYLYTFMDIETNASLRAQGVYEFTNSANSGRWSSAQQVYGTRTNADVSVTRRKIRGKGRALQLKFYSDTGKPFTLLGWSVWETANANV